jgi:hypothetical protein
MKNLMQDKNVKIIRSKNRKRTISARFVGDEIHVYLPYDMQPHEEEKYVKDMLAKLEKRTRKLEMNKESGYLVKRANEINKNFFNGKLNFESIKYVTNQKSKFGSCTPARGTIRISDKIAGMPQWVIDYVIIHELSHLIEPNHSKNFWNTVNRYKYAERAIGYLLAKSMDDDEVG